MKKFFIFVVIIVYVVLSLFVFYEAAYGNRVKALFTFIFLIFLLVLIFMFLLNRLLLTSNWYRNNYIHTYHLQDSTHDTKGYLDIVNLGSNPALFAFFYDNVKGQNWATGTQGPEMDLEILNLYKDRIKKNGIVLIPIVAFSSCSPYLYNFKPSFLSVSYFAKFSRVLAASKNVTHLIPHYNRIKRLRKYPLFYKPKAVYHLFKDEAPDLRKRIDYQPMQWWELEHDADKWINCWMKEFDIKNLETQLDSKMERCHEECAEQFAEIVRLCKASNFKPYLIFPPMSSVLASRLSETARDIYIYSFVRRIQQLVDVEFLDYLKSDAFSNPEYYFNSFFLNLKGRKLFTHQVLNDLGLLKENVIL